MNKEKERNFKRKEKVDNYNNHKINNGSKKQDCKDSNSNRTEIYSKNKSSDNLNVGSYLNRDNEKSKKKILIIIISIVIILVIVLVTIFILKPWKKKDNRNNNNFITDSDDPESTPLDETMCNPEQNPDEEQEETYKIIENPKLKRIKIDKKSNENVLVEGMNQTMTLYKKSIYDISSYKEYSSGKENGISYSKKTTYAILLLKDCLNTENEIEDCEIDESNNLRHLENGNEKICLLNITDDNIILSTKFSSNFDETKKAEIISDLDYIKYFLDIKEIDDQLFNKGNTTELCGFNCEKKISKIKHNDSTYEIISNKNKTISSGNAYRNQEEIIIQNEIRDKTLSLESLILEVDSNNNEKINITDNVQNINTNENYEDNDNNNYNEIIIFSKEILNYKFILKNRIENKNEILKAYLILIINDKEYNIEYLSKDFELNEIKNYKSNILKIYNLLNELYENIKDKLENINEDISNNFNSLYEQIYYKNIEEILSVLETIKSSPETFISQIDSTKSKLDSILEEISEDINPYTERVNTNITKHTQESLELINKISENIKELKNLLSSQENIFTKIAIYYLNDTSTSYVDIIEKAENIFRNYYKYDKESINSQIETMLNKFENNIEIENRIKDIYEYQKYFDLENNNINSIDNDLNNAKTKTSNIINKVKEEFENKITRKENGYYISANEIQVNNDKFNEILNSAYESINNLNNLNIIDKTFDKVMIGFKDNFTELLRFLEEEKINKFPLEEDILKDGLFSSEEKQKMENELKELGNNIIKEIKENQEKNSDDVQKEVEKILNNKNDLDSYIIDLDTLCSFESLKELSESFEGAFVNYLKTIKNNIKITIDNYLKYLNNNDKILKKLEINVNDNVKTIKITKKFENLKNIKEYIENEDNLVSDLSKEFIDIFNKITEILINIRNNTLNEKYKEITDLSFINENINEVNILYERIPLYFSKNIFEEKYKEELSQIITEIKSEIEDGYNSIESLKVINKCDDEHLYIELQSGYHCINIFDEPNEEINFNKIYTDLDFISFKNKLNKFYSYLNESMNSYNSKLVTSLNSLSQIEKQSNENNIILNFNSIENKIDLILSQKFEEQLINSCYNYYESNVNKNIQYILSEFLNKLNNTYDYFKEEIIKNLDKFKYSFNEFNIIAAIYQNIIYQNVTRNYFDYAIIDIQKNNFNYSISYYYTYFISLINSFQNYIIYNLPLDKNGLNINIEEYKNIINKEFIKLIEKVNNSKNDHLKIETQTYILSVPRTNFFKVNSILSNNILKTRNLLEKKIAEISAIDDNKDITKNSLVSRFYLENSNNAKQLKDFYSIIYNDDKSSILNPNSFKEIIINNFNFDKNEFINKIDVLLNDLNKENNEEILKLKENIKKEFDKELSEYITNENKDGILDKITNLYNGFKFSDDQINDIYNNINEILNKIVAHMNNEKKELENSEKYYKNDYSEIEEKLSKYKNEIINKIESKINEIINEYGNNMVNKVYNNKVETDLNNYIEELKKSINDFGTDELLNSSYNYGEIILNINEVLVSKYKELVKKAINYKKQIKLMDILNIEYIKQIINKKIDNEYNNNFLPMLKQFVSKSESNNYNFKSSIDEDIESTINSKLSNIETIMNSLKTSNQINTNNFQTLNINKNNQKNLELYISFISSSQQKENIKLKDLLTNIIISKFGTTFNNTVSSFGKVFFGRYNEYNKISKIINFYQNFRYCLVEFLLYYQIIYAFKSDSYKLPKDLINKIHNLNYMDEELEKKNVEIINEVKEQITSFKEIIKDEIIQKHISNIKDDTYIKSKLSIKIIEQLNIFLENECNIKIFEDSYYNIIENSLNEQVYKIFVKDMNEGTKEAIKIFKGLKNEMIGKISDDSDGNNEELNNINLKLNEIVQSIEKYSKNYNYSFKISNELSNELIEDYNQKIYNAFKELVQIINEEKEKFKTKFNDEISNIDKNFNYENLNKDAKNKLSSIENNLNNINKNIDNFSNNLKRKLDDKLISNNEGILYESNEEAYTFQKILRCSKKNKIFINTYEYNKKLNELINDYNSSYKNIINSIENGDYQEDIKEYISSKLSITNIKFLNYYKNINQTLYNLKTNLNTSIYELDTLIKQVSSSYNNIINEYINLINEKKEMNEKQCPDVFKQINYKKDYYNENFVIKTTIEDKNTNNFNIIFQNINNYEPNIKVSLKKEIRPQKMEIDIIHNSGDYKISLIFDFNNSDNLSINKCKIDFQLFEINSNINSEENKCRQDCYKIENFEYKQNDELNLLN